MSERGERAFFLAISLIVPLGLLTANVIFNIGGILLTIALIVWMGFALAVFSPFLA